MIILENDSNLLMLDHLDYLDFLIFGERFFWKVFFLYLSLSTILWRLKYHNFVEKRRKTPRKCGAAIKAFIILFFYFPLPCTCVCELRITLKTNPKGAQSHGRTQVETKWRWVEVSSGGEWRRWVEEASGGGEWRRVEASGGKWSTCMAHASHPSLEQWHPAQPINQQHPETPETQEAWRLVGALWKLFPAFVWPFQQRRQHRFLKPQPIISHVTPPGNISPEPFPRNPLSSQPPSLSLAFVVCILTEKNRDWFRLSMTQHDSPATSPATQQARLLYLIWCLTCLCCVAFVSCCVASDSSSSSSFYIVPSGRFRVTLYVAQLWR